MTAVHSLVYNHLILSLQAHWFTKITRRFKQLKLGYMTQICTVSQGILSCPLSLQKWAMLFCTN